MTEIVCGMSDHDTLIVLICTHSCMYRCFPHVVNIAVQHGLSALTDLTAAEPIPVPHELVAESHSETSHAAAIPPPDPTIVVIDDDLGDADMNGALESDMQYADALRGDPIKNARQLISVCRASGQRREEFKNTITEGNRAGSFGEGIELPKAQLLRDVDTRWSSTFLMIDRLLELYPVRTCRRRAHLHCRY